MSVTGKSPWAVEHVSDLTKGMNVTDAPELLQKSEMINLENIFIRNSRLNVDTGYKKFQETVHGTPRACFQFFKTTGASELVLITNDSFYTRDNDQWFYVSDGTSTTTSVNAIAGATSVTVASITGFSNGDGIGIALDDGSQHQTTINAPPAAGVISFADALPSDCTQPKPVVKAVELSGTDDDQISLVVMAAYNYLVFTNANDNVKYYDGTAVQDVPNLPSTGNCKCKAVGLFNNHLILFHTIEGGTAIPQRIRWSAAGDPTDWTSVNDAGYVDLFDSEDFIITGVPIGPYVAIYRERSIYRMEYLGSADKLFNFDEVVSGEGARSVDSVVDVGTEHIFVGNSNVYRYRGGFDLDPMSDKLYDSIFGEAGEINSNYSSRIICIYIEELDEVWFFYPTATSTYPKKIAKIKMYNEAWTIRVLTREITGYGFFSTSTSLKWNELVGSWAEQSWKWGGAKTLAGSPTTLLCSNTSGNQVYEYDYVSNTDDGDTISWTIETKEFYNPDTDFRTDALIVRAKGNQFNIYYSTDGGKNWNLWKAATISTDLKTHRFYKQVVANRIRFRFTGTGPGFSMVWYAIRWRPESETVDADS